MNPRSSLAQVWAHFTEKQNMNKYAVVSKLEYLAFQQSQIFTCLRPNFSFLERPMDAPTEGYHQVACIPYRNGVGEDNYRPSPRA